MPPRGAVLFDVDGTLVDTNYPHVLAWVEAFAQHGYEVSAAAAHRAVGMGSDRYIEHLIGQDDDEVRRAHSNFYAPTLERLRAFPKVRELLTAVAGRGLTVVLATSASRAEADRLVAAIDAGDAVSAVVTKDDVGSSKPAPDVVTAALDEAGAPPERAVFVGDTVWDVEAAGRAGIGCIGLLAGGLCGAELTEAGAVAVYRDPADLLTHLADSPIGAL